MFVTCQPTVFLSTQASNNRERISVVINSGVETEGFNEPGDPELSSAPSGAPRK